MDNVKTVQWRRDNEKDALDMLSIEVQLTEFWIHKCGFFGASPEGLVSSDGIVVPTKIEIVA